MIRANAVRILSVTLLTIVLGSFSTLPARESTPAMQTAISWVDQDKAAYKDPGYLHLGEPGIEPRGIQIFGKTPAVPCGERIQDRKERSRHVHGLCRHVGFRFGVDMVV